MEYPDGETLARRLAAGPLPIQELLRIAIELAGALQQMHRDGVVYGSLEPSRVLLTSAGVRLSDPAPLRGITPYTAPEQLRGDADPRSDIFALGAVLYELASGRKAFTGESPDALRAAIVEQQPAPLSGGPVYGQLERIVASCLAKDPDRRRQRVQNVLLDLKLLVPRQSPAPAPRGRPPEPAPPPVVEKIPVPLEPLPGPAATVPAAPVPIRVAPAPMPAEVKPAPDPGMLPAAEVVLPQRQAGNAGQKAPAPLGSTEVNRPRLRVLVGTGWTRMWRSAALVAIVAALAMAAFAYLRRSPARVGVLKFAIPAPERTTYPSSPAISPNGRLLAFTAMNPQGKRRLWVRPLDSLQATELLGTEDALAPFWSPDSQYIAFFAGRKLKKIAASGGPPQVLCDSEGTGGGTWNAGGAIVFGRSFSDGLYRVSASGDVPQPLTRLNTSRLERAHLWPRFLPGGKHFLYYVLSDQDENTGIYAGSLDGGESRRIAGADSNGVFASRAGRDAAAGSSYLLFARGRKLLAQPFETARLELKGEPFTVAEEVNYLQYISLLPISASDNGLLAYQSIDLPKRQLVWFDRSGNQIGLLGEPGEYGPARISRDGRKVAINRLTAGKETADLWVFEIATGSATQITTSPAHEGSPVWSPDGSRLAFFWNSSGHFDLYQRPAVRGGSEELLVRSDQDKYASDWSPDGRYLLFGSIGPSTNSDLWVQPLFGDRKAFVYAQTVYSDGYGVFSPDGRWIAYQSDETGRAEVYVEPFPRRPGVSRLQVSNDGGGLPRWRRDGKELFYITADGKIKAVAVKPGAVLQTEPPRILFQTKALPRTWNLYDVTADGERFLVNTPLEWASSAPITVVANWSEGLNR